MLKAVLSGNYVNFGVFRLYGDDALDNALQTFIKLLLSIPHSDLLVRAVRYQDCVLQHSDRLILVGCSSCRTIQSLVSLTTLFWRC